MVLYQEKYPNVVYLECIPSLSQVQAANIMDIPVICTEQYPKGEICPLNIHIIFPPAHTALGNTVTEIDVTKATVFAKTLFSMLTPDVIKCIEAQSDRKSVVLFGIEVKAQF